MEDVDFNKDFNIVFTGPDDYSVLRERAVNHFLANGANIVVNNSIPNKIYYNLELANIKYNEVFKDGLFGIYLVEREANVKGMFNSSKDGKLIKGSEFEFNAVDTVFYSNISNLENIAYSFTQAELPDEPFFSSTFEPVIAIGTAAVAVYLFFNIRSK